MIRRFIEEGERAAARYTLAVPRRARLGGAHLGRRGGSSLEFQEHRDYQPGDDLRHLDWPAYARSDRLIVKLYREEVQPHLDLLLDGSRSMALPGSEKARAAVALAAFFTRAAIHAGLSQRVWLAADGCRQLGTLGAPLDWEGLDFSFAGDLAESIEQLPPRWRPAGVRVVISDLLWRGEPRALLARLGRGAAAVWVVQLVAAVDVAPAAAGFGRLEDSESGQTRDLLLDRAARSRYHQAFETHRDGWRRACREAGASMVTMVAEHLVDDWSPESLADLLRQGIVEAA